MGLSCSCDDFDKADFENWWEGGYRRKAPAGITCCECGGPVEEGAEVGAIDHFEVFDPPNAPDFPTDQRDDESDNDYEDRYKREKRLRKSLGWEDDYERYERCTGTDYRCERCDGLAESIESLGYCMIAPGDLIECHIEYAREHSGAFIKWTPDAAGVSQPHRWTKWDHIADRARQKRQSAIYFVRHGWRYKWWNIKWKAERAFRKWGKA